jgi:hypothetical protein
MTRASLMVAVVLALPGGAIAGGHCHERSPIVGRMTCKGFGDRWAHEGWKDELEIGFMGSALVAEHLAVRALDSSGVAYNAAGSANYRLTVAGNQHTWAVGARTGIRWHARHAIAGLEVTVTAPVESPSLLTALDGYGPISSASVSLEEAAVYGGAHWRLDRLDLSALALGGVRSLTFFPRMPDGFTTCPGGAQGRGCAVSASEIYRFAGVRGGVDLWLTRNLTLGVSAGVDLTDRSESFALEFHVHLAPYDGA